MCVFLSQPNHFSQLLLPFVFTKVGVIYFICIKFILILMSDIEYLSKIVDEIRLHPYKLELQEPLHATRNHHTAIWMLFIVNSSARTPSTQQRFLKLSAQLNNMPSHASRRATGIQLKAVFHPSQTSTSHHPSQADSLGQTSTPLHPSTPKQTDNAPDTQSQQKSPFSEQQQSTGQLDILFIQRAFNVKDNYSGHIAFPGGHVEVGENDFDACIRECYEEIGLNLRTQPYIYLGRSPKSFLLQKRGRDGKVLMCFHMFLLFSLPLGLKLLKKEIRDCRVVPLSRFLHFREEFQ